MIIYEPASAATHIPVIDLADSYSADGEKRRGVAWEIHKACVDTGFFYIKNHSVPPAVMHGQLALAERFFELPMAEKRALMPEQEGINLGYEPIAAQTLDEGSPPDLKEGFKSGLDVDEHHRYTKLKVPGMGRNLWPQAIPGFKAQYESYVDKVLELARHLAEMLALSLELPDQYFADALEEPLHYCRILKYPPLDENAAPNQLGAGAHTDWGLMTLLLQDEIGGLEVRNADGQWIAAPPIDGTFIVNLGEMLPVITNDRYKATMHRVLNNETDRTRYSCPTFIDPEYFYKVKCAPTILEHDGGAKYPELTAGEHLRAQFEKSFGTA